VKHSLACGIDPATDCHQCRTSAEYADVAHFSPWAEIPSPPQAPELAEVLLAQRKILAPILLEMLVDDIADIALAVAQEVRR
jgi:hypothetical protein